MTGIPASLPRQLRQLRDRTTPLFDLPEAQLRRGYRKGGWNVRQLLVHISDVETVFLDRMRRVVAQDKALLMAIDPDGWADRLDYRDRDLAIAQAQFVAARSSAIELIERHRDLHARTGVHSENGKLSLADIAGRVAWHHLHHLEQVEKALKPGRR